MRTDIGFAAGHASRIAGEHLEREAQPVLDRPAVLVLAPVGERRDEAREQVAVGAMELDHVEAGPFGTLDRRDEFPDDPAPCRRASSSRGTWLSG